MFWQKIGNSVSDRLFRDSVRDSVIAENQCLYIWQLRGILCIVAQTKVLGSVSCSRMGYGVVDSSIRRAYIFTKI